MNEIRYHETPPDAAAFLELRAAVGWTLPDRYTAAKALAASVYAVSAYDGECLAGTGRIVGDGAFVYFIADVMIHPDYQRRGVGSGVMSRIMEYLRKNVPANGCISLMCAKGREDFYRKIGFFDRPDEKHGAGMMITVESLRQAAP